MCAKKTSPTSQHLHQQPGLLTPGRLAPWSHAVDARFLNPAICRFISWGFACPAFNCPVMVKPQIDVLGWREWNLMFQCCSTSSVVWRVARSERRLCSARSLCQLNPCPAPRQIQPQRRDTWFLVFLWLFWVNSRDWTPQTSLSDTKNYTTVKLTDITSLPLTHVWCEH